MLPNGHIAVCGAFHGYHRLHIVDPSDGTFIRYIDQDISRYPNEFCYPSFVAALPNGHVVVNHRDQLQIVNPSDGTIIRTIGIGVGGGYHPHGLTVLPNGHVVVNRVCSLQIVNPSDGQHRLIQGIHVPGSSSEFCDVADSLMGILWCPTPVLIGY